MFCSVLYTLNELYLIFTQLSQLHNVVVTTLNIQISTVTEWDYQLNR